VFFELFPIRLEKAIFSLFAFLFQAATTDSVQLEAMVVIEMVVMEPTTHGRGEHVKTPP
jgi:hypothetical protein